MAKMLAMPDSATIMAARKKVDFYLWKGIPVARAWPVPHGPRRRSQSEINTTLAFAAVASMTGGVDESIREVLERNMAGAHGVTWVDFFRSLTLGYSDWVVSG